MEWAISWCRAADVVFNGLLDNPGVAVGKPAEWQFAQLHEQISSNSKRDLDVSQVGQNASAKRTKLLDGERNERRCNDRPNSSVTS